MAEGYNKNTQTAVQNKEAQKREEEISGTAYAVAMGTAVAGGFVGGGGLPGAIALPALTAAPMLAHDYGVWDRRVEKEGIFPYGPTDEQDRAQNAATKAETAKREAWAKEHPEEYAKQVADWSKQMDAHRADIANLDRMEKEKQGRKRQEQAYDPFVDMVGKAARRAEQMRRGEKPSAEAPSRGKFLGPRAESRPESRAESRAESAPASRAESRAESAPAMRELESDMKLSSAEYEQERQRIIREIDTETARGAETRDRAAYNDYKKQAAEKHRQYGMQGAGTMTFEEWKGWAKSMEELKSMGGKK
jgi:hypothetical protein